MSVQDSLSVGGKATNLVSRKILSGEQWVREGNVFEILSFTYNKPSFHAVAQSLVVQCGSELFEQIKHV